DARQPCHRRRRAGHGVGLRRDVDVQLTWRARHQDRVRRVGQRVREHHLRLLRDPADRADLSGHHRGGDVELDLRLQRGWAQATRSAPVGNQTLAWNNLGNLTGVTATSGGAAVASYVYGAGGSLFTQTEGTKTTVYLPG